MTNPFKTCPLCRVSWLTREAFLGDRALELIGYQPDFAELDDGTLMFNHEVPGCETTMEVEIGKFSDLYEGPSSKTSLFGTDRCEGHCLRIDDLERCDQSCFNAWAREVAVAVRDRMVS